MSFFNFLKKKNKESLPDYSFLGTDIHSHLIPGIDDGARTVVDSLNLINGLRSLGYKKIITTPHIMSDHYKNTPDIINNGLDLLKSEMQKVGMNIEISAAAEYYVDYDFLKKIPLKNFLTINQKYVLVEFSYFTPNHNINELFFELQTNGYKVILAHPERYTYWHNNIEIYKGFKDRDVLFQLNINSLTGEYSIPVKKFAEKLIDNNMIELAGTDLHNEIQLNLLNSALSSPALIKLYRSNTLINNQF